MECIFRRSCETAVFEINGSLKDLKSGYSKLPNRKLTNLQSHTISGCNKHFYDISETGKNNYFVYPQIYKKHHNNSSRGNFTSNKNPPREFTESVCSISDFEEYTPPSNRSLNKHSSKLPILIPKITQNIVKPKGDIHWLDKYMKIKEKLEHERKNSTKFAKLSLPKVQTKMSDTTPYSLKEFSKAEIYPTTNLFSLCKYQKLSPIASASISVDSSRSSSVESSNSFYHLNTHLMDFSVENVNGDEDEVPLETCKRVQSDSATLPPRGRNRKLLHSTHSSPACPVHQNPHNPDQLFIEWWKDGILYNDHKEQKKPSFPAEDLGKSLDLDLHTVNQMGGPDSAYSSLNRKSPVGGEQEKDVYKESAAVARFCHECGAKYPVLAAKFCCQCGVRRLAI